MRFIVLYLILHTSLSGSSQKPLGIEVVFRSEVNGIEIKLDQKIPYVKKYQFEGKDKEIITTDSMSLKDIFSRFYIHQKFILQVLGDSLIIRFTTKSNTPGIKINTPEKVLYLIKVGFLYLME